MPTPHSTSVVARLADASEQRPPFLLIHGSANAAAVWALWQQELAAMSWSSFAIDLRGHGQSAPVDLSSVRMADYADDVRSLLRHLHHPPVLLGWSMGGLIAMMVAASDPVAACIALAPSLPAQQFDTTVTLRHGVFNATVYGILHTAPAEQPAMPDLTHEERRIALDALSPESQYARDERQRGIIIQTVPCPLLIVTGTLDTQWPSARYDALWLNADRVVMPDASHWGLVLNQRALRVTIPLVVAWLEQALRRPEPLPPESTPSPSRDRYGIRTRNG